MTDEILLAVDENDRPLGRLIERSLAIQNRIWRRAAGGLIVDPLRQCVLCHRRSDSKDERPGFWVATFGGKVRVGETVEDAAIRELAEEFGMVGQLEFRGWFKSNARRQFEYTYVVSADSERQSFDVDRNEVSEITWLPTTVVANNLLTRTDWFFYGYELALLSGEHLT